MLAVILNGAVLLINLRVSNLENQLAEKRRRLQDFMTNHQGISFEIAKQTLYTTSLNQLKLLRRLSQRYLSPNDYQALSQTERVLAKQIEESNSKIVVGTFIQGGNLPEDTDLEKLFGGLSQDSLEQLFPIFQKKESEYVDNLMAEMNRLDSQAFFWKTIYSSATVLSMTVIVIGSILLFRAGKAIKAEIPKAT